MVSVDGRGLLLLFLWHKSVLAVVAGSLNRFKCAYYINKARCMLLTNIGHVRLIIRRPTS